MSQRSRALLLVGVLSLGAVGCELVADFDRSKIDAGPIPELDSGEVADATSTDGSTKDTNQPDTTVNPDAGQDTSTADTNVGDTNTTDTNVGDTNVGDTNTTDAHDANVADTNVADTNVADTNVADTNVADTNVADTNVADTNVADTNIADTNVPDTNDANTACNALDPTSLTAVNTQDSTSAPPTLNGGTLPTSGTFALTNDTFYFSDGGSSGTPVARKYLVQFTATGMQGAVSDNGGATTNFTADFSNVSSPTFTATYTCGLTRAPDTVTYDVSGTSPTRTVIITADGVEYQTFAEQ